MFKKLQRVYQSIRQTAHSQHEGVVNHLKTSWTEHMPQALISTWLNKPKQRGIAAARDAKVSDKNSTVTYALEELSRFHKHSQEKDGDEIGSSQPERQETQGQPDSVISVTPVATVPSEQTQAEDGIIANKPHTPEQVDERLPAVHPHVSLQPLDRSNMPAFKVLNTLLPVAYSERFYHESLTCPVTAAVTMVAMWSSASNSSAANTTYQKDDIGNGNDGAAGSRNGPDLLISAIRCRLLQFKIDTSMPSASSTNGNATKPILYISTLATKPAYRSYGVATALLDSVIRRALHLFGIWAVEAHVWDGHEDALAWYLRRGFVVVKREEGYYRRLRPTGAVLLRRVLER